MENLSAAAEAGRAGGFKQMFGMLFKTGFSQELFGEEINTIGEELLDRIIMGDKSNHSERVAYYQSDEYAAINGGQKLSPIDAERKANEEFIAAIIETVAVTGFMSMTGTVGGFASGKLQSAVSGISHARNNHLLAGGESKGVAAFTATMQKVAPKMGGNEGMAPYTSSYVATTFNNKAKTVKAVVDATGSMKALEVAAMLPDGKTATMLRAADDSGLVLRGEKVQEAIMEDVSNMTTEDINGVFQKIAAFENAKAVKEDIANGTAADTVKADYDKKLKVADSKVKKATDANNKYNNERTKLQLQLM